MGPQVAWSLHQHGLSMKWHFSSSAPVWGLHRLQGYLYTGTSSLTLVCAELFLSPVFLLSLGCNFASTLSPPTGAIVVALMMDIVVAIDGFGLCQ